MRFVFAVRLDPAEEIVDDKKEGHLDSALRHTSVHNLGSGLSLLIQQNVDN